MSVPAELKTKYDHALSVVKKSSQLSTSHNDGNKHFIILSGISGTGKTTIGKILEERYGYQKLRNVYTRPMRPSESEKDGIFIDEKTFEQWDRLHLFLTAHRTNGVLHGMLRAEVERVTKSRVWADKSVTSLLHLGPVFWKDASLFYLLPPSIEVLWERLILRETQLERSLSLRDMENRVSEGIDELKKSIELPYSYVINQKLEDTVDRIVAKL